MKRFENIGTVATPILKDINKRYEQMTCDICIYADFDEFTDNIQNKLVEMYGDEIDKEDSIFELGVTEKTYIFGDDRTISISLYNNNKNRTLWVYPEDYEPYKRWRIENNMKEIELEDNEMLINACSFDMIIDYMKQACNDCGESIMTEENYIGYVDLCEEENILG